MNVKTIKVVWHSMFNDGTSNNLLFHQLPIKGEIVFFSLYFINLLLPSLKKLLFQIKNLFS